MLRCVKNEDGVIIAMGSDEGQSGEHAYIPGTWCEWTVAEEDLPAFEPVDGAERTAMRFKENGDADGIELRSDEDVLAAPNG